MRLLLLLAQFVLTTATTATVGQGLCSTTTDSTTHNYKLVVGILNCPDAAGATAIKNYALQVAADIKTLNNDDYSIRYVVPSGCGTAVGFVALGGEDSTLEQFLASDGAEVMSAPPPPANSVFTKASLSLAIVPTGFQQTAVTQTVYYSLDCANISPNQLHKASCITLESLATLVAVDTSTVVSRLLCTGNAVPVPYYSSGVRSCQCECPSGTSVVNNVCTQTPSRCSCHWSNQCYQFRQTVYQPTTCNINNVVGPTGLSGSPIAYDNYVSQDTYNPPSDDEPQDDEPHGPHIKVQAFNSANSRVFSNTYSWSYFLANRNTILNSIAFHSTGIYTLKLFAYDWTNNYAECDTVLEILDAYQPRGTATCPTSSGTPATCANAVSWTYQSVILQTCPIAWDDGSWAQAAAEAEQFSIWLASRINDVCGTGSNCDSRSGDVVRYIGGTTGPLSGDVSYLPATVTMQLSSGPIPYNNGDDAPQHHDDDHPADLSTAAKMKVVVDAAILNGWCKHRPIDNFVARTNANTCGGPNTQIAYLYEININEPSGAPWHFRFGIDFGYGGFVEIDGTIVLNKVGTDSWWVFDWAAPTGVFDVTATLAAGAHTIRIYGAEPCCDGGATLQYSRNGSPWSSASTNNPWDLAQTDINALALTAASAASPDPKYCTKCVAFGTVFGENVVNYVCPVAASYTTTCNNAGASSTCNYNKCLSATAKTFFSASSSITPTYAASTLALIHSHFATEGYNNINQVHVESNCGPSSPNCGVSLAVSNLFSVAASLQSNFAFLFPTSSADNYVKFRFKIGSGAWQDWSMASTAVQFSAPVTNVVVEAVSQCGVVACFKYFVYAHNNQNPPVCSFLATSMFYQATRPRQLSGAWCNNAGSDFVEITFDLDTALVAELYHNDDDDYHSSNQVSVTNTFSSVQCQVKVDGGTATQLFTAPITSSSITRFAVNLDRSSGNSVANPQKVDFTCTFQFTDAANHQYPVACPSVCFSIADCDGPGWDCPWGACQLTCPAGQLRPNQACGGYRISKVAGNTVVTPPSAPGTCCQSCGATTCSQLSDLPDDSIKMCVAPIPNPYISSYYLQKLVEKSADAPVLATAVLLGAMTVVGAVALLLKRQRTASHLVDHTDGYSPLL